jgi:hypothetical protein
MTRQFLRGDVVALDDSPRTWTFLSLDGDMASLRDASGAICSVPVASLWLVRAACSPCALWLGIAVVLVFAAICAACVWRVATGRAVLGPVTGAVLLSIASVAVIAWMVVLLRGAWRRQ